MRFTSMRCMDGDVVVTVVEVVVVVFVRTCVDTYCAPCSTYAPEQCVCVCFFFGIFAGCCLFEMGAVRFFLLISYPRSFAAVGFVIVRLRLAAEARIIENINFHFSVFFRGEPAESPIR